MRRRLLISAALVPFVATAATVVGLNNAEPEAGKGCTLQRLIEVRTADYRPEENDGGFTFPSEQPGLTLQFALDLPDGVTMSDAGSPSHIHATDSTGSDLTQIEPDFMGKKTYVKLVQSWDEPSREITLHLAPPARNATHVSVQANVISSVYESLETVTIPISGEWTAADESVFDGATGSIRLQGKPTEPVLAVRPGSLARYIEEIALVGADGKEVDHSWTMSNDEFIHYGFNGKPKGPASVKITIRRGFRSYPFDIVLKNHPLP